MNPFELVPKPLYYQLKVRLTPNQFAVAFALVSRKYGQTYREVAEELGTSIGTVYTHLRRIRRTHPKLYADLMERRKRQLKVRHRRAIDHAKAHTHEWYLKNDEFRSRHTEPQR